jgi:DNA-binding LytR/AlgR family response regulator
VDEILLKCAVVDDSSLQRLSIVKLIMDHPNLKVVAQYNNAIETKNGLLDTEVDLIFLDIEMPILSGFDLLDDLPNKPQIIFVTGKTKYAFKAFDYDAVDYIHKPESFPKKVEEYFLENYSSLIIKTNLIHEKITG